MNNNPTISILPTIPSPDEFTPLAEHQSQTPSTFFGAKPVLYASFTKADVLISKQDVLNWPAWTEVVGKTESGIDAEESKASESLNGSNGDQPKELQAEEGTDTIETRRIYRHISGFITSESVILYRAPSPVNNATMALTIPYPSISLHAIQRVKRSSLAPHDYSTRPPPPPEGQDRDELEERSLVQALYLQLDLGNPFTRDPSLDEDAGETVSLLIAPTNGFTHNDHPVTDYGTSAGGTSADAGVKLLFESLSKCADLHPDPANADSDEEGGDGATGGGLAALMGMAGGGGMPGSGGWITSENVHEFEGQFGGDEVEDQNGGDEGNEEPVQILGPGAGARRAREDEDAGGEDEANGDGKWQRTS
jgi:nucleotide-sensitive chloride channel 1A